MTAELDPGLVVREARPDEWAVAGAVVEAAYRADPLYAGGDDDYLRHVADVADRARTCRILVAVDGGVIRGCLTLVVRAGNGRAQRLYERLGYRRAPARDFEPVPGIRLEGYELDL